MKRGPTSWMGALASLLAVSSAAVAQAQRVAPSAPASGAPSAGIAAPRAAGASRLTIGMGYERVGFGDGIAEADLAGANTQIVKSARQLATTVQFSTVISDVWLVDIGSSFSAGSRATAKGATAISVADSVAGDLNGIGDVRVRVSRRFDRLGLRVTAGANIPTGITSLDGAQTATLSVLGSPALALTQPAVGFGAGGTLGIVKSIASASKQWGVAVGASVEWRGEYEPFAAIAAGIPLAGYDPGEVIRVSAGATRLFGSSKGLVTASLDLFGTDKVRTTGAAAPIDVRIGPTFSLDAQWLPATTRLRTAGLFAGVRVRSALERNGEPIDGSGNLIFEAGGRGAKSLTTSTDMVFEVTGRVHTAVAIDNRLATAAGTSVAPAIGLAFSGASWTMQPMVTARLGTVDTGVASGSFQVLGARLTLERRF